MPIPSQLLSECRQIVGERQVVTDSERLEPYGRDETPGLAPALPDAVVRPGSADEVSRVLRACSQHGVAVTPRGGGTGHSGGCVAVQGGVVLAFERMQRILEISADDLTADVEPGVVLQDLHAAVEERGLFYPPDPGSLDTCTLGGNVAENAGGPRALRYGVTRDYVLGLEIALPAGDRLRIGKRTVKGVSGYDLTSLIVGSEGTLAVITAVTLKLIPRPRSVATALVTFDSAATAAAAVSALFGRGILPRTLEYMDGRSIDAVRPTAPFRFPEQIDAALIVETDGDDDEATLAQLGRAVEILDRAGARSTLIAQDARQQRDLWTSRRGLTEATRKIRRIKIAEDIAVPRRRIPEALARVAALGERCGVLTAAYGHAGDGNLHVQILFDDEGQRPAVERLLHQVMAMAIELGGTLSGEHGIGIAKKKFMPLEHSAGALDLMRRLKRAFDPAGILNPGKIF
ncbi:MAG: FAD-binding protein [Deltaproteobacteria bacterium]|nr:FAD-binding protein [Deltaproteobacteria bacterium]